MVTIASTANRSLHKLQTLNSENNNKHLHEATFSPYLNNNEGTFIGKFDESSQKLSPLMNNRKSPLHQGEKKEHNGEIGVFGAEKYFSEGEGNTPRATNIAATKYLHQRDQEIALENMRYKVQYGTPSIRSESTCNSQSTLLQSGMRNSQRNMKNKVQAKSFLAGLGLKCSCSDKDSVDISNHAGEISFNKTDTYGVVHGKTTPKKLFNAGLDANHSVKISKPHADLLINTDVYFQKPEKMGMVGLNRENSLAFSKVNSGLGNNHLVKVQLQLEEEIPRKSIEVFGSPILNNKIKSLSFDKRLTMPSRDAISSKMEEFDFSAKSGSNYNDAASDASSDLFEIESFKGKHNSFLDRQASDAASSCVSPTNYAPSEASIEWSVVTASAAVMSDCDEQMSEATIRSPIRIPFGSSNGKPKANREIQKQRPSMLSGCKSHKAVRVAGDAFRTYEKPSSTSKISYRTNTSQVTRFPTETRLGNSGARHGQQHGYATPPLKHSHSPHASKLLYI